MNIVAEDFPPRPSDKSSGSNERVSRALLVYTAELLPYSQTFVRDHVTSLARFAPVLVGAKLVEGLSLQGLATAALPDNRWSRLMLSIFGISPELDCLVQAHGALLVHAHFADAGARVARYCRRRGLPLIVTLHGSDVLCRPHRASSKVLNMLLWRRLMRSAQLFLPVSDYLARKALERGFPASKLRRHYLGIPLNDQPVGVARKDAAPAILFIGRLVEKKGVSYLLDACRALARDGNDFKLKIIGDGPLLEKLRAQATPLGNKVTFAGALTPEQIRSELSAADMLCMPSIQAINGDNEGLPIVSLEAQAAGIPVVAFNQGPVPEAVRRDETGLLAEDRSVDDLARCLRRLLLDPQLRHEMGQEGRRHVEMHFDITRRSRELENIYDELIRTRPKPAIRSLIVAEEAR